MKSIRNHHENLKAQAQAETSQQQASIKAIDAMLYWAAINLSFPMVLVVEELLKKAKAESQTAVKTADTIAQKAANIDAEPTKAAEKIKFRRQEQTMMSKTHAPQIPVVYWKPKTKLAVKQERELAKGEADQGVKSQKIAFRPDMALKPQGNLAKSNIEKAESLSAEETNLSQKVIVFRNGVPIVFRKTKTGELVAENSPAAPSPRAA